MQGFQGDTGAQGVRGFQGATGAGSQGAQGDAGGTGTQGAQGAAGGTGTRGPTGSTGSPGSGLTEVASFDSIGEVLDEPVGGAISSVQSTPPGLYTVTTTADFRGCAILATANTGAAGTTATAAAAATSSTTLVITTANASTDADEAFSLMITC